ncbi:MAG: DUF2130 domain-containing protein [Sphingobacteriales bacterium]|jgi:hypothetical protein|nr:DUF2130 domain-containing protein [Sphingobacteriales bacterium]OJW03972.1 MAG: hypothetical protein BGO52_17670 [Sphingobacteriales bacterium 44-61]
MATDIKCPNCGHQFEPNDAIREEVEKELRSKAADWQKKKNEEFQLKLEEERKRMQQSMEENIRKNLTGDFENKLRLLEQNNKDNEEKLKLARQKELEYLKKEQELKNKEDELEITVQKKLQQEREKLSEDLRKIEEQKVAARESEFQLRLKELEKQLEDQKKLADEMRRKAEQGSTQLQGEIQELALEEMLRTAFPFDLIAEVGKGIRGADCVQTVRNNLGQECGKIIYESKRTNNFIADWIEKLKTDMRSLGADMAVIVTRTMPRDMDGFGLKDGVWICSYSEVKALAVVLRDTIMRVSNAVRNNENKGDKMHMLYDYLTSNEFAEQWKAIREGFLGMKISIQKERDAMEKLWKTREKQLEKVLLNATHIRGSIEGIAGMESAVDLHLLEDNDDNEDDMAH